MKTKNKKLMLYIVLLFLLICTLTACGRSKESADEQEKSDTRIETDTQTDTDSQTESSFQTDTDNQSEPDAQTSEEAAPSYHILSEGDAAPDFTADLADGTTFTLSEQQGKVILLNFWATWCGPCVREMPAFEKMHGEYEEDVVILAVNCMEDTEIVDAFLKENGYTFPIAYDTDGSINMRYPTQGIPYTLVIDAEGIIQNIYVGAADAETQYQEYKGAIDAISN